MMRRGAERRAQGIYDEGSSDEAIARMNVHWFHARLG
jgi:hypothetical protein